ncbi:MAG: leucine-rich repeat protein, partial [Clostridia bacterium]|nr:leucine-rich repeat protein [Clostridia bacterium]
IKCAKVETITLGTFTGDVETVVLPNTIETVKDGAFSGCGIKELYFYDNISEISDDSFVNCPNFSTLHINAIEPPRYGPSNLYSEINLADKYDILMLNAHKKKVIVFGGSGAYNSIDTNLIEDALNENADEEEYIAINMAVNGWFNAPAQFDMMLPFIGEGDILIHAPESSSATGLMYTITMLPSFDNFTYNRTRFFACLESNYDLISLIDIRNVTDMLNCFAEFNAKRQDLKPTSYTDFPTEIKLFGVKYKKDLGWIDDKGNFALSQESRGSNVETGEADMVAEYITEESSQRLNSYYDKIRAKGAEVFFITAPLNKDTLELRLEYQGIIPGESGYVYFNRPSSIPFYHMDFSEWQESFDSAVEHYLECEVLATVSETFFTTKDFFDLDYHLSDDAVPIYTEIIINSLKNYI